MDEKQRSQLTRMGWDIHGAVESAYLRHPATRDVPADWKEKQRLLLADMAIHLLQTALKPGAIELDQLKNNLHSILTLSDQFLPHAGLKAATEKLYAESPVGPAV
ncbi:hypothetical protein NX784_00855 [Massilia pinisoli]|uniref:Uncharacterized protein n=1 Tax=Massilia pinisoli TaxID=1772194 RepID=A0ABT1ZJP6_9BURK|nr:hypothetical protein [Massilia pinisoli]MCS0580132.1 hypothetical protein [Massilia pinisoli]